MMKKRNRATEETQAEPFVYKPWEIAEKLRINEQTVLKHIREGKLGAHKIGRVYRITQQDLTEYLRDTHTKRSEKK